MGLRRNPELPLLFEYCAVEERRSEALDRMGGAAGWYIE